LYHAAGWYPKVVSFKFLQPEISTWLRQGTVRTSDGKDTWVKSWYDVWRTDLDKFNVYGSVHRKYIPIFIQQDATLHTLFYLETALRVSGGTSTHHQKHIQLYLQHLVFFTPLLLSAAIVEKVAITVWQIPDAVDTVVCAPDDGWRYQSKHVKQI
jgi:hypothetical protein